MLGGVGGITAVVTLCDAFFPNVTQVRTEASLSGNHLCRVERQHTPLSIELLVENGEDGADNSPPRGVRGG